MNMIGTDGNTALYVHDDTATVEGDGPKATHCFGVLELAKRVIKPHGYCIAVDADGDQIAGNIFSMNMFSSSTKASPSEERTAFSVG